MFTRFCFLLMLFSPAIAGETLDPLFEAYHQLQTALAGDDLNAAKKATGQLEKASSQVTSQKLDETLQPVWKAQSNHLATALKKAGTASDLDGIRQPFEHISMAMIALSKVAHPAGFQEYHCPMALDNKGANWLQKGKTTANPYFGSSMLRCGAPVKQEKHSHKHH